MFRKLVTCRVTTTGITIIRTLQGNSPFRQRQGSSHLHAEGEFFLARPADTVCGRCKFRLGQASLFRNSSQIDRTSHLAELRQRCHPVVGVSAFIRTGERRTTLRLPMPEREKTKYGPPQTKLCRSKIGPGFRRTLRQLTAKQSLH